MFWTLRRESRVAVLRYARPPINMMSYIAAGQLLATLESLERDTDTSIVVLTGDLPGYFIAHADLEDIGRKARQEPPVGDPTNFARAVEKLEAMPQPTVAAVNGQAWGGGCELSLACTFRVASESAHFRLHEVSKGAIPGGGGTQRLPRLIGLSRASWMILASKLVKAEEALAIGLVDALLPDQHFSTRVLAWLEPLLAQPPHALFVAKRALVDGLRMPFEQGLANERRLFMEAVSSPAFVDR